MTFLIRRKGVVNKRPIQDSIQHFKSPMKYGSLIYRYTLTKLGYLLAETKKNLIFTVKNRNQIRGFLDQSCKPLRISKCFPLFN